MDDAIPRYFVLFDLENVRVLQTDDNAASVLQLSSANFGAVYFVQVCE